MSVLIYRDPAGDVHADGVDGAGYFLCGYSEDGVDGADPMQRLTAGKITCTQCLALIQHVRAIPRRFMPTTPKRAKNQRCGCIRMGDAHALNVREQAGG